VCVRCRPSHDPLTGTLRYGFVPKQFVLAKDIRSPAKNKYFRSTELLCTPNRESATMRKDQRVWARLTLCLATIALCAPT